MTAQFYISPGNRKMDLPTWSLPAGKTCPGCTPLCGSKCYAKKAERAYPQVLPSRKRNWAASKTGGFVAGMIEAIESKSKDWFRIHESGDFYSQSYLDKWIAICEALPSVRFLAFTKSFQLNYSKAPKNLAIVWSVFPDTDRSKIPAGPRSYAGNNPEVTEETMECPGQCHTCLACWNLPKINRDIHFNIH